MSGEVKGPENRASKDIFRDFRKFYDKNRWMILLGLVGVALLIAGNLIEVGNNRPGAEDQYYGAESHSGDYGIADAGALSLSERKGYERLIEEDLVRILSQIEGVGEVSVDVVLENEGVSVYASDKERSATETDERDREGGTRTIREQRASERLLTLRDGRGEEAALVTEFRIPEVRGVLVVAEGARDSKLKTELAMATATLLGVPPHRVMVLPKGR